MNARDLAASWQLFHKASGLGAPIADERQIGRLAALCYAFRPAHV